MYKGNDDDTFTLSEIPMRLVIAVDIVCVFIRGTNEVELTGIYSIMGCNGHKLFLVQKLESHNQSGNLFYIL